MKFTANMNWKYWRVDSIGLAAIFAVSVVGFVSIIRPMASAQTAHASQEAELSAKRETVQKLHATLNGLGKDLNQLEANLSANSIRLEPAANSNQRLADLTHLAAEHTIEFNEVRTGTSPTGSPTATKLGQFEIIPIHLTGSGTFSDCTAFMHHVRQRFADTGVASFELADSPSDSSVRTTFRFELHWYAVPAPTASAARSNGN